MDSGDRNLKALTEATEELSPFARASFEQQFIGALAGSVSEKQWRTCLAVISKNFQPGR